MVETVKLDKDFFHQFFTSKPLLLGTDVVTSTSVQVQKKDMARKRAREDSGSGERQDLVRNPHVSYKYMEKY